MLVSVRAAGLCWRGTGKEIVEQSDWVVPFEWYVFIREPAFVRSYIGIDEESGEESVKLWQEEW